MLKWVFHYVLHTTLNFYDFTKEGAYGEKEPWTLKLACSQISPSCLHILIAAIRLDMLAHSYLSV